MLCPPSILNRFESGIRENAGFFVLPVFNCATPSPRTTWIQQPQQINCAVLNCKHSPWGISSRAKLIKLELLNYWGFPTLAIILVTVHIWMLSSINQAHVRNSQKRSLSSLQNEIWFWPSFNNVALGKYRNCIMYLFFVKKVLFYGFTFQESAHVFLKNCIIFGD